MAVDSRLAEIIAIQIGKMEGELEARVQEQALSMLEKFVNKCPVREDLVKIAKTRNRLLNVIDKFDKRLTQFNRVTQSLKAPIIAIRLLIKLLERNPVPSAVIVHPGGKGVSLGRITKLSGRLRSASKFLESLEADIESVNGLVDGVRPSLDSIRRVLNVIDVKVTACVETIEDRVEIEEILNQIQPPENTGSEGIPEKFKYRGQNGKEYVLQIIEDTSEKTIAPRRIAVARDNIGVIVLQGQASFSSDTDVLLSELKFRIDNQLP